MGSISNTIRPGVAEISNFCRRGIPAARRTSRESTIRLDASSMVILFTPLLWRGYGVISSPILGLRPCQRGTGPTASNTCHDHNQPLRQLVPIIGPPIESPDKGRHMTAQGKRRERAALGNAYKNVSGGGQGGKTGWENFICMTVSRSIFKAARQTTTLSNQITTSPNLVKFIFQPLFPKHLAYSE